MIWALPSGSRDKIFLSWYVADEVHWGWEEQDMMTGEEDVNLWRQGPIRALLGVSPDVALRDARGPSTDNCTLMLPVSRPNEIYNRVLSLEKQITQPLFCGYPNAIRNQIIS